MMILHRIALVLSVFCITTLSIPQVPIKSDPVTEQEKSLVLSAIRNVVTNYAYVPGIDFGKWDAYVSSQEEAIKAAQTQDDLSEALNIGMAKYFGASHLVLITPRAAEQRRERKVVGIGIRIEAVEQGLRVVHVFDKTPAQKAGIQIGDIIAEADGKKLAPGMTIQGPEGSEVTLTVLRGEQKLSLPVKRAPYSTDMPDTLQWIDNKTAVLKVNTFMEGYKPAVIDELMSKGLKAEKMVLDLRGNGGGAVLNLLHLLSYFLPADEPFGYFLNKQMVNEYVRKTGGDPTDLKKIVEWANPMALRTGARGKGLFTGKVAVLINGASGSASEIIAAALKEIRKSPVVGTRSAGAVLVSTIFNLPNGWQLQYPFMDYLTSKGARLEGNGVTPDIEAATPRLGEKDLGIENALKLLSGISR